MSSMGQGYFPSDLSPDEMEQMQALRRRQAYAQALMNSDTPQGRYGGLASAGNKIMGAFLSKRMDAKEQDLAKGIGDRNARDWASVFGGSSQPPVMSDDPRSGGLSGNLPPQTDPEGNPLAAVAPQAPANPLAALMGRIQATGNTGLMRQLGPSLVQQQISQAENDRVYNRTRADTTTDKTMTPASPEWKQANGYAPNTPVFLDRFNAPHVEQDPNTMTAAQKASNDLARQQLAVSQGNLAETKRYHDLTSGAGLDEGGQPNPVIKSYADQIHSGNMMLANVPMGQRGAVAKYMNSLPAAMYSPTAASKNTLASSRITAPYTNMAAYKLTADGLPYLQRIDAAMKHPGSVSDQDLLDSLTKLNTGGNAVTEAQVALITGHGSLSDWAGTMSNKLKNGGALSDNQRQQIKAIANDIFTNYRKGYQPVYEKAASQLREAGIPEAFWTIPDLNKLNAGQMIGGGNGGGPGGGKVPPPPPGFVVHP